MSSIEMNAITKQPEAASASAPPPPYSPAAGSLDPLAMSKFANTKSYSIMQGRIWGETICCGCLSNRYMISDNDRLVTVPGREGKKGATVPTPLFLLDEESSLCCRICCAGMHPVNVRFYHANPVPEAGKMMCCGLIYPGHVYKRDDKYPAAVMTMERPGCCSKWLCGACCICMDCCQSEGYMHAGEPPKQKKVGERFMDPEARIFSSQKVPPAGGGGFTPTLNIFNGLPEKSGRGVGDNFASVIEGPCLFGGCLDLCIDTVFFISSKQGKSGDIGTFAKKRPDSLFKLCCQSVNDVDEYTMAVRADVDPLLKANLLGAAIHTDYLYFERDARPCMVYGDDQNGVIVITLCTMYFRGCIIPICCCIPYGQGGN